MKIMDMLSQSLYPAMHNLGVLWSGVGSLRILAGAALAVMVLLCYSLVPSLGIRYLWKQRSRRKALGGRAEKRLYLTFDDGPSRTHTTQLLCLLRQYQIKASFFVVAEFAGENPDLIAWMEEEGHLVGIHSVCHQNALFRGRRFVRLDMKQSIETMEDMGCKVRYYRPPWGHLNLWTLFFLRYWNLKLILWDVMAQDWSARETASSIQDKLLERVFPGAVVCLHDGRGSAGAPGRTVEALRMSIPILLEQGYSFERVDAYE